MKDDPTLGLLPSFRGTRTGLEIEDIKQSFIDNLFYGMGRTPAVATRNDLYTALAITVRDRVFRHGIHTVETHEEQQARRVAYLSAEYLPGPHLGLNLLNLGITEQTRQALSQLGYDLDELIEQEDEPGLGNGGLGRLAACYLDSLASLQVPAIGYGIRYEFGIFDQTVLNGWQVERTDKWLRYGNPWEVVRPDIYFEVKFGGHTEHWTDDKGNHRVRWVPNNVLKGEAYDTPILGYRVGTSNLLRLWKAEAVESFDFAAYNVGDYYRAVEEKMSSENITKVLYPNDELIQGKILRLQQQFFFVSCSLQDLLRVHQARGGRPENFHEKNAVQLNDTHPAVAVAELMRLLLDEHALSWEEAWEVTSQTIAYTNHTLLPEALEKWPVEIFARLLPRHLEIVYEINRRFLDEIRTKFPGDNERIARMSLIDESGSRFVRMANLATVAGHRVNGVAQLHSDLLKKTVLADFAALWPEKFCNVTNGVNPRRFLALGNPALTRLITECIGDDWLYELNRLRKLESFATDTQFQKRWREARLGNKRRLAKLIEAGTGIRVDPQTIFDILVKRIHEYKRQHLCILHILTLYLRLKHDLQADFPSRTFVIGGKAAPGYFMAKLIIKLVNAVSSFIENDPAVRDRLKVVFFPGFNVKSAQHIYPAADLSEQISIAGKEASGTGNMKFALNGALTIGTLDGANIEIREEVGEDNFFLFGLTVEQVAELRARGYRPRDYYEQNSILREVLDLIGSGALSHGEKELFRPIVDNLLQHDPFFLLADYQSYIDCQDQVNALWADQQNWTRKSILNAARMGKFSADRSIDDYCERIWNVKPVHVA
ncbi:MAG: glycogen/starch/alpha-glucan phosphorylase [Verrucomicrobia bacterium]|nr:glycogen/starch/alpha-glucan phosphorylase [Verrucomicrobiota bacterium]